MRSIGAALAPGSRWDTQQGAVCVCLRPRGGSLRAAAHSKPCIFIAPRCAGSLPVAHSCLELVPFLPPPRSSPSHHLSGRNTCASPALWDVAGSLTFSRCFFSPPGRSRWKSQALGGFLCLGSGFAERSEGKEHPCPALAGSCRAAALLERRAIPRGSPVLILCVKCWEYSIGTFAALMSTQKCFAATSLDLIALNCRARGC